MSNQLLLSNLSEGLRALEKRNTGKGKKGKALLVHACWPEDVDFLVLLSRMLELRCFVCINQLSPFRGFQFLDNAGFKPAVALSESAGLKPVLLA